MVSDQKYLFDCEYTRRLGGPRAGSCGPRTLRHEEISIKIFFKYLSSTFTPASWNLCYFSEYLRHQLCLWCLLPVNRGLRVWSDFAAKLAEQEFIESSTQLTREPDLWVLGFFWMMMVAVNVFNNASKLRKPIIETVRHCSKTKCLPVLTLFTKEDCQLCDEAVDKLSPFLENVKLETIVQH